MDGRPLVFVIDDQAAVRLMMALALERVGYRVLQAAGVREGVALLAQEKPDVVVADAWLGDGDAALLMATLRGSAVTRDTPVILVSGREDVRALALEVGAAGYLAKPFGVDALRRTVAAFVPFPRS